MGTNEKRVVGGVKHGGGEYWGDRMQKVVRGRGVNAEVLII